MKPIRYGDGQLVMEGDEVEVRRWLRRPLSGRVVFVYDADRPVEREVNDYGVAIRLSDGSEIWCGFALDTRLTLKRRVPVRK